MEPIKLAIVEDDRVVRENLRSFLGDFPDISLLWVAPSVEDLLQALSLTKPILPDILLLDIQLPGMTGIEGISWIKQKSPDTDIVMLTTFEDEDSIFQALRQGACSYLSKRTSLVGIRDAILVVSRGGSYMSPSIARKIALYFNPKQHGKEQLSPRQQQIVQGIMDGLRYQEIADRLHISLDTVRSHIKKVYRILEVNSKAALMKKMMK